MKKCILIIEDKTSKEKQYKTFYGNDCAIQALNFVENTKNINIISCKEYNND